MKNLKFILPVLLCVGFYSCTERIDLELNDQENERLVVEGWITDQEKAHTVELTLTSSYFENQPAPRVMGAEVTISDGETTWTLSENEPGIYQTTPDVAGEAGKTYTLTIDYEGQTYTATSFMRPVAPVDSMAFEYIDPFEEFGFEGDPYYEVKVWTQELAGLGDCYTWFLEVNGEQQRDTLSELSFVNDDLYDGNYVANTAIDILEIGEEANAGDTVYLEQWNIGIKAYDIFNGILTETDWGGGLFDTPPANVETNLSEGAIGYFGAASVSSRTAIIPE
ncbi:DUF4249 domain-containing protein [Halocola ammonii]